MNIWLATSAIAASVLFVAGAALAIRAWQVRHVGRHRATAARPPARSTVDDFDAFAAMVAAEPELAATLRHAWKAAAEEEPS